jgi:hypothetical protein
MTTRMILEYIVEEYVVEVTLVAVRGRSLK